MVVRPLIPAATAIHVADLYRDGSDLVGRVAPFLAEALAAGGLALVLCSPDRARSFELALSRQAVPLDAELPAFVVLDREELLYALLADGRPDPDIFDAVLGRPIRAHAAAGRPIRVYGEMTDLLWRDGRLAEVVALEQMWIELQREIPIGLYCAYDSRLVDSEGRTRTAAHIDSLHGAVVDIPAPIPKIPRARATHPSQGPATPRSLAFPAVPASVSRARNFVRGALEDCDEDLVADVEAVASELTTNAVVHAGTNYMVVVDRSDRRVRLTVVDSGAGVPRTAAVAPLDETGRGLLLVGRLATHWGVRRTARAKFVWADFEISPPVPRDEP